MGSRADGRTRPSALERRLSAGGWRFRPRRCALHPHVHPAAARRSAPAAARGRPRGRAPAGRCRPQPATSRTKPAPIATNRRQPRPAEARSRSEAQPARPGDLWRFRKADPQVREPWRAGSMNIIVHRPLTAAFPQVGGLSRPSRRARAGSRASRQRKTLRRRKPSPPAGSFDCGRFAPFAQDDEVRAPCARDDEAGGAGGHTRPSALDRRFSAGRRPFQAEPMRPGGAARIPTEEDPPPPQAFATGGILRLRALRALRSG